MYIFAVALKQTIIIKFAAFFYYVNRKHKSYFELKANLNL